MPRRYSRALSLAGAALGLGAVLAATHRYGPAVSHDSIAYLHAARSLLQGRGFEYFGYSSPYIQWPPLFPVLLAAAELLGADPVAAARWLNAAAFAAIVAYGSILLGRRLEHRAPLITGVVLLIFAAPLIEISRYVWTETIFVLLFLAFFDAFERYRATGRRALLIWAAVFSALAWLDRYVGVTVVMTAVVFLLAEKRALRERIKNAIWYGAVAGAPMLVWMARNYLVSGTLAGVRTPSPYTLADNLRLTAAAFATWLPSGRMWAASVFTAAVAAITLVTVLALRLGDGRRPSADRRLATIAMMVTFAAIYLGYLIAIATRVALESINSRFMDPLYALAVLVFITAADLLLSRLGRASGVLYRVALVLTVAAPMVLAISSIRSSYDRGAGSYSTAEWRSNRLIQAIRSRSDHCTYYSNAPDAVYAITGIHAYWLPKKSGPPMYGFEAFRKRVEGDPCTYVAWFGSGPGGGLYGVDDLEKLFRVEVVDRNSAGTIYRVALR